MYEVILGRFFYIGILGGTIFGNEKKIFVLVTI